MSMNFAPWQGASNCTGSTTPGALSLLAWCREAYPQGSSMGIYNCRTVVGGTTTSLHGEGRALDYGMPMVNSRGSSAGHELVRRLGENGQRLGVQAIIYDRQIWSARSPNGRAYTGVHPHYDHLHIELTWNAARNLNLATLRDVLGGPEEGTMYVIRRSQGISNGITGDNGDPYVRYWQTRFKQMGYDLGDFGPNNDGVDGKYGATGERVVNEICQAAGLPQDGDQGFNVNAAAHFERRWALEHVGGGSAKDGEDGKDGREIELRARSGHIQWRYVGGSWSSLVPLEELKGPKGDKGDTPSLEGYAIPLIKKD